MNKIFRSLIFYLLVLVAAIMIASWVSNSNTPKRDSIAYSEFTRLVKEGKVVQAVKQGTTIHGTLQGGREFTVVVSQRLPDEIDDKLAAQAEYRIEKEQPPSPWYSLLYSLLPVALVLGAFFFIMQQTQGSGNRVMQFGKSRARLHNPEERKKVTFDDVAGIDEVKEELVEIVDFLKHPKRYMELGARIPKGVLLFGPPGTGKTLLARAIAGEAGVPFFSISGSDFVEMFVGVGASRVRDLFDQAKKNSPCILFIDEIDAVGRMRGAGYGGGHDEREQTLNQLLVEMDGFGVNEGIIVVAATNRPDVLDPALLRPGRFDRHVVIDKPDLIGRKAILGVHAKGKPLAPDVDLEVLAKRTPGFTGADLANLLNESALLAARKRHKHVNQEDLEASIDRVISGGPEKRSRIISDKEKRITAYHEAGHALVGAILPHCDPVHKVTIIPRGRALGLTYSLPVEDRYINSKPELMDRMAMALGGRASEELIFGDLTSGAQGDIEYVTNIARRMVTEWGMSEKLGPLSFGTRHDEVFLGRDFARQRNYSEEIAALIDDEVRNLVTQAHEAAARVISTHRKSLDRLALELLERETLEGAQLEAVFNEAREQEKKSNGPQSDARPKEKGPNWLRGGSFEPQPAG